MDKTAQNRSRGFTVLELLIVVAILGLLASVISAPVMASRRRARDAKRIEDLQTIRDALEMYIIDHGNYPPAYREGDPDGYNCLGYYYSCETDPANPSHWDNLMAYLAPYIQELPVDPINTPDIAPWNTSRDGYCYAYGNVFNPGAPGAPPGVEHTYDLTGRLETPTHPERCGNSDYRWWYSDRPWCVAFGGSYPDAIYEASIH